MLPSTPVVLSSSLAVLSSSPLVLSSISVVLSSTHAVLPSTLVDNRVGPSETPANHNFLFIIHLDVDRPSATSQRIPQPVQTQSHHPPVDK